MVASIEIGPDNDMPSIAASAGQPDVDMRYYENGRLYIIGVTQEALDTAYAAYDEQAYLTAQEVRRVQAQIAVLRQTADEAVTPLQDAVDIDEATDGEVALLKLWKQYRVALNRIAAQAGYPHDIVWPVPPS